MRTGIFFFFLSIFMCLINSHSKLQYIYANIRHGARYQIFKVYDGPQAEILKGQTSPNGFKQSQKLGQLLRKQYIDDLEFLSQKYDPREMQTYYTVINRTFTSMSSFLYGLYPPGTGPIFSQADEIYGIPPYSNKTKINDNIYTLPKGFQPIVLKNILNPSFHDCTIDNSDIKLDQIRKNQFQQLVLYRQDLIKQFCQIFNVSLQSLDFLIAKYYFDVINVDISLGRPLPSGFTSQNAQKLMYSLPSHKQVQ